ncbi:MAG: DUF4350 domain-containing protein [Cytophagaceae bacterium]|nr:MAG: DUF4350 domain-containing protein [Cytophagaceae bacterium]
MSSLRLYLLGLLALFGAYVALEYLRPKPVDWSLTLSNKDQIPYGTYALYDVLPQLLGTDEVASVRLPVYNQFFDQDEQAPQEVGAEAGAAADTTVTHAEEPDNAALNLPRQPTSYLFVNENFRASQPETQALLKFVAAGNDVFIAASWLNGERQGKTLLDSLRVRWQEADSAAAARPHLADSVLVVRGGQPGATLATDEQGRAVLVRLDRGRGHVYLCSVPLAFSNYYVLPARSRGFALAALSYLPTGRPVWWDEYQKQGRVGEQSVLRVLLGHESLRTAYYLLWVTALLFIFIEARRRQRIIPVLKPLPNTTLLFTRTVASLYQQGRNHAPVAEKKVALFLDFLRTRFQEAAPDLSDDDFRERLSQKSGVPRARIDELVRLINFARTAPAVTDHDLLTLSRTIRDFKREVH